MSSSFNAGFMLAREEKYIYDWETTRGKGKWQYILLNTLVWGTLLPVIIKLFKIVLHTGFSAAAFSQTFLTVSFLFFWLKFIAGVFVYSLWMWQLSFRKYKELKQKQMMQRLQESDKLAERIF